VGLMNQAPTEDKSKPTINQIPTVLNKGSLFIRWYLKSSLSPFLCLLFYFSNSFFCFFNFFLTKPGRKLINIYGEQNGKQNQKKTHRKTEESVGSY
jgi:hypothetical protein